MTGESATVGIIMGSQSDWETMRHAADTLTTLKVAHETRIVSAHRTPKRLYAYAEVARDRGLKVIIAGAGGAAHLPGMTAAMTPLPVLGVPVESMRVAVVQDLNLDTAHAVLVVYVGGKGYVLDNQIEQVVSQAEIYHYRPYYTVNENAWWLHRS